MRTLLYVPVIHMDVDLGSLAEDAVKRGVQELGEKLWEKHSNTVLGLWEAIIGYFEGIDVNGFSIYQDGMVADGEMARRLVEDGVKKGSKNYELISGLIKRGAVLRRTEELGLVKEERDWLLRLTSARSVMERVPIYIKYRLIKNHLLRKRDRFIAKVINLTLKPGKTGVLFIGAYHNVIPFLDKDIFVKEIKDIEKIRAYQRMFIYGEKVKEKLSALSAYLVSPAVDR